MTSVNVNSDEGKSPIKAVLANILNVPLCHQPFFRRLSACVWMRIDELVSTGGLSLGKQNVFVCSFLFVLVGKVKGSIMNHSPPMSYCTFCGISVTANCTTVYLTPSRYLRRNGFRRHSLVPKGVRRNGVDGHESVHIMEPSYWSGLWDGMFPGCKYRGLFNSLKFLRLHLPVV